jgi:creatinine amidohydrolase
MNYETLLPREFAAELERFPVAYLPWGALEWHGEHLPLGLDGVKAHALCCLVAERTGGIVLPPVWCGFNTMKQPALGGFPYTLDFPRSTVMALLYEYLKQLAEAGFKLVVVLAGHYGPPHVAALVESANTFTIFETAYSTRVLIVPEYELVLDLGYRGDHAAKWETSIFMHLHPEQVAVDRLDETTCGAAGGILGEDPRTAASAGLGAEITQRIVERLAQRVTAVLKGDD